MVLPPDMGLHPDTIVLLVSKHTPGILPSANPDLPALKVGVPSAGYSSSERLLAGARWHPRRRQCSAVQDTHSSSPRLARRMQHIAFANNLPGYIGGPPDSPAGVVLLQVRGAHIRNPTFHGTTREFVLGSSLSEPESAASAVVGGGAPRRCCRPCAACWTVLLRCFSALKWLLCRSGGD